MALKETGFQVCGGRRQRERTRRRESSFFNSSEEAIRDATSGFEKWECHTSSGSETLQEEGAVEAPGSKVSFESSFWSK